MAWRGDAMRIWGQRNDTEKQCWSILFYRRLPSGVGSRGRCERGAPDMKEGLAGLQRLCRVQGAGCRGPACRPLTASCSS